MVYHVANRKLQWEENIDKNELNTIKIDFKFQRNMEI